MRLATLAMACAAAALQAAGERVVCPVTADTYVYATPWASERPEDSEAFDNHGGEAQVVLMGREYFALLNFDLSAARGMTVERARLRIFRNPNQWPLATIGWSTISGNGPWEEGAQRGGRAQEGNANYYWARAYQQPWAFAGSDLADVMFGGGGSLYAFREAREAGDGWYEIDIPPELIHALLAGDQYGLVMSDEKGQTRARYSLASREQSNRRPTLTIEGERVDTTPPGEVRLLGANESTPEEARRLGRTTLRPGSVILRFGGAGDDAGAGTATRYELRYSLAPIDASNYDAATPAPRWMLDPLAPKPHPLATSNSLGDEVAAVVEDLKPGETYYFAARAWDEAGNQGPVSPLGAFRAWDRAWPQLAEAPAAEPEGAAEPEPGPISVWAVPELLKIDPKTGALLEQADAPDHRLRNRIWDAATNAVRLTGARNEFVAFQLAIEVQDRAEGIEVSIAEPLFAGAALPEIFRSTGAVQLYREWFVPDDVDKSESRPWYPDALVPLSSSLSIPSADNPVPGQKVQPVFVDIYIPRDAAPGRHEGRLLVRAGEAFRKEISVRVDVLPFTLPDRLNFIVDLNGYGSVPGYNLRTGTPEYRALVRAYHRMAHLHRANLNILGYSHSGSVEPDYSPPLAGEGAATVVANWENWDAHFGPLVDGSAFWDLPRAGVPIATHYLNFHENWPGDLRASYKWDNYPRPATTEEYRLMIARHGLEAGPIEEGFPESYQERFSAVVRQFAEHFRERGWTQTRYQVYFNNKHYYKDPAQGGRGVSWWLLDEPNYRDDFRALSFFGHLARRGMAAYPDVPIIFRVDISYIDFMRDILTGQVDLNTTSKRFFSRNRFLTDHRDRYGREFWNYASTNHPRDSNTAMREWAWRVWAAGGDGIVPWNAISGAGAWERAEPLTVFYPGIKFGKYEPLASLRLKAFRRGQQDVEYLVLLSQTPGWDREAVSRAVAFNRASDAELDRLRLRVAAAIAAAESSGREP